MGLLTFFGGIHPYDGKDISKMPIAYDENPVKKFNKAICEELGIPAPEGYVEIA